VAVSKSKVCLKGTKISGYCRHAKNVALALKAILQQEFQKCFQRWQHYSAKFIAAQGDPFP
jgi:hypothetical protein